MAKNEIPESLVNHLNDAIERRVDLEAWRQRAIAKGIAADDSGKLLITELIMKRARRLQLQHSGKKPAR
jgi:predicted transcriptional regulator